MPLPPLYLPFERRLTTVSSGIGTSFRITLGGQFIQQLHRFLQTKLIEQAAAQPHAAVS